MEKTKRQLRNEFLRILANTLGTLPYRKTGKVRIFYGEHGTGKSYQLRNEYEKCHGKGDNPIDLIFNTIHTQHRLILNCYKSSSLFFSSVDLSDKSNITFFENISELGYNIYADVDSFGFSVASLPTEWIRLQCGFPEFKYIEHLKTGGILVHEFEKLIEQKN